MIRYLVIGALLGIIAYMAITSLTDTVQKTKARVIEHTRTAMAQ